MAEMSIKNHNDPRAVRTRKLLVQALSESLLQKPFDSLTVQEIAAKATLNRATFYAHFEDKNALLDYTVMSSFREFLATRVLTGDFTLAEHVKAVVQVVCDYLELISGLREHKDPMVTFEALMERQIKTQIEKVLLDVLLKARMGSGKPSAGMALAAIAASWAIYGAAIHWSHKAHRGPVERLLLLVQPMVEAILKTGLQAKT
jgi:AcrR family transcriptional regulator